MERYSFDVWNGNIFVGKVNGYFYLARLLGLPNRKNISYYFDKDGGTNRVEFDKYTILRSNRDDPDGEEWVEEDDNEEQASVAERLVCYLLGIISVAVFYGLYNITF